MFVCIILCAAVLLVSLVAVTRSWQQQQDGSSSSSMTKTDSYFESSRLRSWLLSESIEEEEKGWTRRPAEPVVIGYAVSLIKCSDFQSSQAGLIDAALVLQHSVHQTSVRATNDSGSVYDYRMYAIVHTQAAECAATPLKEAGYTVLIRDPPITHDEIEGSEYLRDHIQREWCCGDDEFIKLYAYTLFDVPIVVHVDMDFVFHKPMDDLFDAMLYSKDSAIGQRARAQIPVEFPNELVWPDSIDAFMTRDWPQVIPERKAPFQAGFLVTKPNQEVFDVLVDVVRKSDYVEGYGRDNGWGGAGYGAFVGAMAYVSTVLSIQHVCSLFQCSTLLTVVIVSRCAGCKGCSRTCTIICCMILGLS